MHPFVASDNIYEALLEEALTAYREQQYAERGFIVLKKPLFFARSVSLANEDRIVAIVMVMGLALMVRGVVAKKLCDALDNANEKIPDQRKKQTRKTKRKCVFQVFEGITVLYRGSKVVNVLNLKPIHKEKSSQCSVVIMRGCIA